MDKPALEIQYSPRFIELTVEETEEIVMIEKNIFFDSAFCLIIQLATSWVKK